MWIDGSIMDSVACSSLVDREGLEVYIFKAMLLSCILPFSIVCGVCYIWHVGWFGEDPTDSLWQLLIFSCVL